MWSARSNSSHGSPPQFATWPVSTRSRTPGTSARKAQLWSRGELALDQDFINESFIGRHFTGRLVEPTSVAGIPAVVPTVTGRAWITGTAQYLFDPEDPFPAGFLL